MLKLPRPLAIAAGCLALAAFGTTGVALADGSPPTSSESNTQNNDANTQNNEADEGEDDQGAQDAACEAAGIPPSASDINYDDETGICTLGGGSDVEGPDED